MTKHCTWAIKSCIFLCKKEFHFIHQCNTYNKRHIFPKECCIRWLMQWNLRKHFKKCCIRINAILSIANIKFCSNAYLCVCVRAHPRTIVCVRACMSLRVSTCTCVSVRVYVRKYTRTYTQTHIGHAYIYCNGLNLIHVN